MSRPTPPTPVGYQTNQRRRDVRRVLEQFSVTGGGVSAVNRNAVYTGGNLSSKAEFDRKTDDGNAPARCGPHGGSGVRLMPPAPAGRCRLKLCRRLLY
jgi:hypothetical protein